MSIKMNKNIKYSRFAWFLHENYGFLCFLGTIKNIDFMGMNFKKDDIRRMNYVAKNMVLTKYALDKAG